jgi:hypothetical protein
MPAPPKRHGRWQLPARTAPMRGFADCGSGAFLDFRERLASDAE